MGKLNTGKIVVAGGAGFIGSHLCDHLLAKGEKVVCVDNLVTGNRGNVAALLGSKNFSFMEQDVCEEFTVSGDVRQVYNLASPASPVDYLEKPIETLKAGSAGVKNLLEIARKHNAKFLFASTSEVYGNPLEHPQKESYWGNVNPVGPRGCYDEAKRFGEALCVAFSNVYGVDAKIARIFNTYGPRMRENDGRVIPNFIEQALGNRPLTVYGDGGQTRSFCYVSDMVSGLHSLMNSPEKGPINLGAPVETSILGLAEKIIRLSKSGSKIVYRKLPIDDPERRLPDISLAKSRLSWNPKVPLDEGLKLAISYFQKI